MAEPNTTPVTETLEGLPEVPQYITYQFITDYLDQCDGSVGKRFEDLLARAGISANFVELANNTVPTRVRELFMEAI